VSLGSFVEALRGFVRSVLLGADVGLEDMVLLISEAAHELGRDASVDDVVYMVAALELRHRVGAAKGWSTIDELRELVVEAIERLRSSGLVDIVGDRVAPTERGAERVLELAKAMYWAPKGNTVLHSVMTWMGGDRAALRLFVKELVGSGQRRLRWLRKWLGREQGV